MKTKSAKFSRASTTSATALIAIFAGGNVAQTAFAQSAMPENSAAGLASAEGIQDIVVTAQKREQSINSVPMSITAATGEQLSQLGIKEASDLVKITPGLTFSTSQTGTPVYTLRGIGYDGFSLATRQAVSIYVDETPIPFALESHGASLDVERVEILKGPQGTLFGDNSTGGAVNYIANKPTSTLKAGGSFTYGRFNKLDISGYVSGPITDTLSVRVAVEHRGQSEWQKSYTRDDANGRVDFTSGRVSRTEGERVLLPLPQLHPPGLPRLTVRDNATSRHIPPLRHGWNSEDNIPVLHARGKCPATIRSWDYEVLHSEPDPIAIVAGPKMRVQLR